MSGWSLALPEAVAAQMWAHLFRGDGDEHGGVLLAGVVRGNRGARLVAREFVPAVDGIDYVPGVHGYRRLTAEFVRRGILRARDERLAYVAVHNHGGSARVAFSHDDLASHARGYPALLDIARGQPVGAIVVAAGAVAGELWEGGGAVELLRETVVVGPAVRRLYPGPTAADPDMAAVFGRQALVFGVPGQALLGRTRVGILGAGGGGMLLVEYLSRLGVGELIVVDPDRVAETNLPRLPGARRSDAWGLTGRRIGRLARLRGRRKVELASRLAREANPGITLAAIPADAAEPEAASALREADFLFCAADTMRARLVFNALVQQYGIPGIQIGAKAGGAGPDGVLTDVRSVVRHVRPGAGCLWCNGLISPARLSEESLSATDQAAQRYIEDAVIAQPAVITLNAVAASLAANDFLLSWTGIAGAGSAGYLTVNHLGGKFTVEEPRRDPLCPECGAGPGSRLARGDGAALPTTARARGSGIHPPSRRRGVPVR